MNNVEIQIVSLKKQINDNVVVNDDIICSLCDTLIDKAKKCNDVQSIAFGHIWRADHFFYVNIDLSKVAKELDLAALHLDEAQPDTLLQKYYTLRYLLCNCQYDIQASFEYNLKGLKIAESLHLEEEIGTHFGSIGTYFLDCESYEDVLFYMNKGIAILTKIYDEKQLQQTLRVLRVMLVNVIDAHLKLADMGSALMNINRLENLPIEQANDFDLKIYVDYCYMQYYSNRKDQEKSLYYLNLLIQDGLMNFPSRSFVVEFLKNAFDAMMSIHHQDKAKEILKLFKTYLNEDDIEPALLLCKLNIRYAQAFESKIELNIYYREYYNLYQKIKHRLDEVRAKGLRSKISLSETHTEKLKSLQKVKELKLIASYDELTNLYNRRYLNIKQAELLNNVNNKKIGFVIFDVDCFKEYNDFYGHQKGDSVLKQVAKCIQVNTNKNMIICRYGGDEFVCLCWDISNEELLSYVNRVKIDLRKHYIDHCKSWCANHITLSIGFGVRTFTYKTDAFSLFNDVDDALYMAKKKGRNTIISIQDLLENTL